MTTTELKNAFEWMNKNAFGGRGPREVSYPYVNEILKRGKAMSSYQLLRNVRLERLEDVQFTNNHYQSASIVLL